MWKEIVEKLEKLLPEKCNVSNDLSKTYFQIYITTIPKTIHYEILSKGNNKYEVALHCEDKYFYSFFQSLSFDRGYIKKENIDAYICFSISLITDTCDVITELLKLIDLTLKEILQKYKSFIFNNIYRTSSFKDTYIYSTKKLKDEKNIFTFWHPETRIPGYIKLCMKTWDNLKINGEHSYNIHLINYKNIHEYIDTNIYDSIFFKKLSIAKQVDIIRVLLLHRYGGIWLDADTIITSFDFFNNFNTSQFQLFGTSWNACNIGVIKTSRDSIVIRLWEEGIFNQLSIMESMTHFLYLLEIDNKINEASHSIRNSDLFKEMNSWSSVGNSILNPILFQYKNTDTCSILNSKEKPYILEFKYLKQYGADIYRKFYFYEDHTYCIKDLKEHSFIQLHNSWTPLEFKNMDEKQFLKSKTTLSKILEHLIN